MFLTTVIDLLPRVGAPLAIAIILLALPPAAAILAEPARTRIWAAVLIGIGLFTGGLALAYIPGLQGPFLYDPQIIVVSQAARTVSGTVYVAGVLCLLASMFFRRALLRRGNSAAILVILAGLFLGLGMPITLRMLLGRELGILEPWGAVYPAAMAGIILLPLVIALVVVVGLRSWVIRSGVNAAALAVGALSGMAVAALLLQSATSITLPDPTLGIIALISVLTLLWRVTTIHTSTKRPQKAATKS